MSQLVMGGTGVNGLILYDKVSVPLTGEVVSVIQLIF